ncbi:MAG TPA: GntR family transcriptional regulator [Verrucomicrobiales bacterium]|nr:GntR family transcriptional regulator [Verrucomicrobiales bacterium]
MDSLQNTHYCITQVIQYILLLEIDHHGGIPIYRQIMDQIRRGIVTGQLRPDQQVEQVRSLSARLKINPMTVSKAYSFLEREGLLTRRRGIGLFVSAQSEEPQQRIKSKLLRNLMKEAAIQSIQMGFSENEVMEELEKQFKAIGKNKRSNS